MLEKLKDFKLKDIFKRKALPPVPPEYIQNKRLRKAIQKYESKKSWRRWRNVALASATLSTVLQFTPDLVSTKFDDYMSKQGSAANLSEHFHGREIRVYRRSHLLYPFHLSGYVTATAWKDELRKKDSGIIGLALTTPFLYGGALVKGFSDVALGSTLDAYSISNDDKPANRVNFIRPPDAFTLDEFLQDFTGYDKAQFKFGHKAEDLSRVLFEFIMLHEARHGDQDKKAYGNANESDADVYAFRILAARSADPSLIEEAKKIVQHVRALHGAAGDAGHASTFALQRGGSRIFDAHEDAAAFSRLTSVLNTADAYNKGAFPETMKRTTRFYHLTLALQREGLLKEDAGMKKAADAFIAAFGYFDKASGGGLIGPKMQWKASLRPLTDKYKPVPDKGFPAPKKAKAPVPSA